MKCSFGVASCARMSSARMPPAHEEERGSWRCRGSRSACGRRRDQPAGERGRGSTARGRDTRSTLTATRANLLLQVGEERVHLPRRSSRSRPAASGPCRSRTIVSRLSLFWMIALLAMVGPIAALALRPWHLAQTPSNSCLPRSDVRGLCARLSDEPAVEFAGGTPATVAVIFACWIPQNSAHWPVNVPGFVDLEPGVVRLAGDGVDLPAEGGDPPAVDHVVLGRGHLERDGAVDRARIVSIAITPFGYVILPVELLALDVHRSSGPAAPAAGRP